MEWSLWLRTWAQHARLDAFARRVEWAKVAARAARAKRLFASLSGGKDSVAMVGLLHEAGLSPHCAHGHSALNLPESLAVVHDLVERLDLSLDVVEPEEDPWELLAAIPSWADASEGVHHQRLLRECSAGNLMVQYMYEATDAGLPEGEPVRPWDGSFIGLRAEESKGRLVNRRVRGSLYQQAIDETWTCQPVVDWTARDVFAFLVSRNLPIHPFYRRCCEELGMDPEQQRIDWLFASDGINARGALVPIRRLYPAQWRRLILVRPEMARYAP